MAAMVAARPVTGSVFPSTCLNAATLPVNASAPNRFSLAQTIPLTFRDRLVAVS